MTDCCGGHEIIRGLPGLPPEGEHVVWQGDPKWSALAKRVFRVRLILGYFVLLASYTISVSAASASEIVASVFWQIGLAAAAIGILVGLSVLYANTTVYTVTDKRVVLRFGVAFPMMINIPWDSVESADLKDAGDGTSDIVLALVPGKAVSYVTLWPFARPWKFARVQPMLRGVEDAGVLAQAIANIVGESRGTDTVFDDSDTSSSVQVAT